jgi:hypothetical protein
MSKHSKVFVISAALLLMAMTVLSSGRKAKNLLRSDSGPPRRLRSTILGRRYVDEKERCMDDGHNVAERNGSSQGRISALLATREITEAEIADASAAIANEIFFAIAEEIDVNNPEEVQEAFRELASPAARTV